MVFLDVFDFHGASAVANEVEERALEEGHFGEISGCVIVLTAEVEEAVEDVGEGFVVEGEATLLPLALGDGGADENFTVVEGDDVGGGGIIHEIPMDFGNSLRRDEVDFDSGQIRRQAG